MSCATAFSQIRNQVTLSALQMFLCVCGEQVWGEGGNTIKLLKICKTQTFLCHDGITVLLTVLADLNPS